MVKSVRMIVSNKNIYTHYFFGFLKILTIFLCIFMVYFKKNRKRLYENKIRHCSCNSCYSFMFSVRLFYSYIYDLGE